MNKKQMKIDWREIAGDLIFKIIMAALMISSINYFLNSIDRAINTPISNTIISILKMIISTLSFLGISIDITKLVHHNIRFSSLSIFSAVKKENANTFKNYIDALVFKILTVGISLIPAAILFYKYNGSGVNAIYTILYIYNVDRLFLIISTILPLIVYFLVNLYFSFIIQLSIIYPENSYRDNRIKSKELVFQKKNLLLLISKSIKYYILALTTSLVFVMLSSYFMGISFANTNIIDALMGQSQNGFNPSHFLPKVSYMMTIIFIPILIFILANKTAELDFIKAYILNEKYKKEQKEKSQ